MFIKHNIFGIAWALIVMFLTLSTGSLNSNITFENADKIIHIFMFMPLSLFFIVGFQKQCQVRKLHCFPVKHALILSFCYGLLIEGIQLLLPHRGMEIGDIIANSIGVGMGYVCYLLIYKLTIKWNY